MKVSPLALAAALLALAATAHARVHTVNVAQSFTAPNSATFSLSPGRVAIDGDAIIWLTHREGGRFAYLYRRSSTGQWIFARQLLYVVTDALPSDDGLVMADGVAAIRIDDVLHVFERRANGDWTESATAGTPRPAPGLAISGRRILTARRGCEYDADVHEKSIGSGVWRINGRLEGGPGVCNDHGAALDIDGDVALIANSPTEVREYRRNPTDGSWPQVGVIVPPSGVEFPAASPASLRGNVAFAPRGDWFLRESGNWSHEGTLVPLDYANGTVPNVHDYRGEVVLTHSRYDELNAEPRAYLYRRNAGGRFDQVAVLESFGGYVFGDVSGNVAAVSGISRDGIIYLSIFHLPVPLVAPAAIANDFEAGDITGWARNSTSQFSLASTPLGTVYRQSDVNGEARAWLTDSNWSNTQTITADIRPTAFNGPDKWVGLAVRYVDANNHYYVSLRNTNRVQVRRKLNGVYTMLVDEPFPVTLNQSYRVSLRASGTRIEFSIDGGLYGVVSAPGLTQGRAALFTSGARADFDNVFVGSTASFNLADKDVPGYGYTWGRAFTEDGGEWDWVEVPGSGELAGTAQSSTAGDARAYVGAFTDDQVIEANLRLDGYAASEPGAWFGLLARRVDALTSYYLAVGSSGQIEIRRQLNGTVTVLKSIPFAAAPGQFYQFKFSVIGNQLHAHVNGVFLGGALDNAIARGNYGVGSYRAAFTYGRFTADQP